MKALLITDVQNDFLPGGALAVDEGDQIVPIINDMMKSGYDLIVACKDWHPKGHGSFASIHEKAVGEFISLGGLEQMLWPDHCVQDTKGADFAQNLNDDAIDVVVYKGVDKDIDSYSAFYDNGHIKSTGLTDVLKDHNIEEVHVVGLAIDYCVKYSVIDSLKEGFSTYLVVDACRGVNLQPDDSNKAIEEMCTAGAKIMKASNTYPK